MSETPNNQTFIPKRKTIKHQRTSASRRVYLFSLFSYVALFATLVAVGGVFLFKFYVQGQLTEAVLSLNSAIETFSVADMNEVKEFDTRLNQVRDRVESSVSYLSLFEAIEDATIDLVQYESLALSRVGDEHYLLTASILTQNFDTTLFQRGVYERNDTVSNVDIVEFVADNTLGPADPPSVAPVGTPSTLNDEIQRVTITAELTVPIERVPFEGANTQSLSAPSAMPVASGVPQSASAVPTATGSVTRTQ